MATSKEYKDYVLERLCEYMTDLSKDSKGGVESYTVSARKMFGEYCVYIQDSKSMQKPKALFLLCDECVFVKQYKLLESLLAHSQKAKPYPGAKEWYMIDIDSKEVLQEIITILAPILCAKDSKNT
ncbi:TfoX domain protein [Helicobacter cinaedi PAGU611]|uniref:TfoX domain protein n=1 Tax=Helicobacter cinaedi CCUG 18818 = ATCC BAA-847 TaxID=537971 RepID=A0AAI8QGY7_9HELI|nr:transcriptional regulator [Helicobacter cinaedi]QOQ90928.1 transcriptional regulator [Helicobacter cinaedi]BAM12886.1 TfoX domain protein [Helicobacter cinaedi PAGU611]BAM33161.1 TfoX domain protein [Helicobacter cinaedi CCUG 18818 = ATCC BAA-847]